MNQAIDAVGLPAAEVAAWRAAEPSGTEDFTADRERFGTFWRLSEQLIAKLPAKPARGPAEAEATAAIHRAARASRDRFMERHVEAVYAAVTGGFSRFIRIEDLVLQAAEAFPGLVPTGAQLAHEAGRKLREKEGVEIDQGILAARILGHPRCGTHLCHAMLLPRPESEPALATLTAQGVVDLGAVRIERHGPAIPSTC